MSGQQTGTKYVESVEHFLHGGTSLQGSQFKRVIVIISESRVLDHALVYTALTRCVRQVVFIGDKAAFERAAREPPLAQRRRTAFVI